MFKRNCFVLAVACFFLALSPLTAEKRKEAETSAEIARLESRIEQLEELVRGLASQLRSREDQLPGRPHEGTPVGQSAGPVAEAAPVLQAEAALPASAARRPGSLNASWSDGLRLDSDDKDFSLKIGGRIMNDWSFFSADENLESEVGPLLDGTEFRRARLSFGGTIYGRVEYSAEYDFAPLEAEFKDVYIGVQDIPFFGTVRVGHQKEPFGLSELTSSRHITFMERPLSNIFAPSRHTGFLATNTLAGERATWAAGVFRSTTPRGIAVGDRDYNFTARFTGLPWYQDDGRKMLHLGIAYSRQNPLLSDIRIRERAEAHLTPRLVDTGFFPAKSYDLLGLEGAWINGPLSIQSEYTQAFVNSEQASDPTFRGAYVEGSFFFTGEHRRYSRSKGVFDRVRPNSYLLENGSGVGAWELALRYSWLDLNDQTIAGGELATFGVGLNWYLNANTRFMWNYIFADQKDLGNANVFQTRFQVDF